MDAEKLSQGLTNTVDSICDSPPGCPCVESGESLSCRLSCALEIIDELLGSGTVHGSAADDLLDLRQLVRSRTNAEAALRSFCSLRRQIEADHYLRMYRLRRWLEHHIVAVVGSTTPNEQRCCLPIKLNGYCVEAVRRICLCTALDKGARSDKPVLAFQFAALSRPGGVMVPAPL
jgi:hypothetical protein